MIRSRPKITSASGRTRDDDGHRPVAAGRLRVDRTRRPCVEVPTRRPRRRPHHRGPVARHAQWLEELHDVDQQTAARAGTLLPNDYTNLNPSWAWAADAGISTVQDLATYVEVLVGGGLLSDQLQRRRTHLGGIRPKSSSGRDSSRRPRRFPPRSTTNKTGWCRDRPLPRT
jgi:hypothetical protein